jgi:hypothetical protein
MSALQAPLVAWIPETESEREWALLSAACPQVAATMGRYLIQLRTFLAPRSVDAADNTMRQLARWLVAATDVTTVNGITRTHIEDYKVWLASQPGVSGPNMAKNTQRQRRRMIRIFLAWIHRLTTWPDTESGDRHMGGSINCGLSTSAAIGACRTKGL